jgi:hypothetical protein
MKIIFLDIDGVANSVAYMATDAYFAECYAVGVEDPLDYEVVIKAHHLHLDPKVIQLLNKLVDDSGAKVVLSSTWRIRYSLDEMNAMLKMRGATFEVTDKTPQIRFSRVFRGEEVRDYLKGLKEKPEAFVIIDDNDEFPKFQKQFVRTDEKVGLTQEHVDKALKILGIENGN